MQLETFEIKPIIDIAYSSTTGIYNYGKDNKYPQMIEQLIKSSPTAKSVASATSKFIRGKGNIENFKIGDTTINQLLKSIANDVSFFNGFALHIDYNIKFDISNISYLPFGYVRLGEKDSKNYSGKTIISDKWGVGRYNSKQQMKTVDVFNPNKDIVEKQIKTAGGIDKYKGQNLYVSFNKDYVYPLSEFDACKKDMVIEDAITNFRYKTIKNGFQNINIMRHLPFANENQKELFIEKINAFQGDDNASSLLLLEDGNIGKADSKGSFIIDELKANINDKLFSDWVASTEKNIIKSYNVPEIFISIEKVGITNQSGETMKQAVNIFNFLTEDLRTEVQEEINKLLLHTKEKKQIEIQEISYGNNS